MRRWRKVLHNDSDSDSDEDSYGFRRRKVIRKAPKVIDWKSFLPSNSSENYAAVQIKTKINSLHDVLNSPDVDLMLFLTTDKEGKLKKIWESAMIANEMILLMQAIGKLSHVWNTFKSFNISKTIAIILNETLFFEELLSFILQLPLLTLEELSAINYTDEFWENIDDLCDILNSSPLAFGDQRKLLEAIIFIIPNVEKKTDLHICDGIKYSVQRVLDKLTSHYNKITQSYDRNVNNTEPTPPDNFEDIDIYPNMEELNIAYKPFLRKNITKGAYDDVKHYLDVQFRLLREDFIAPLRQGIADYLNPQNVNSKLTNIKIYHKVRSLGQHMIRNQLVSIVRLKQKKNVHNEENSKHFMFGSLVGFTDDNFNSITFAKIVDRNLSLGLIAVSDDGSLELHVDYTMLESMVFFEPYHQVLRGLQLIDERNFPLEQYLVDVDTTPERPKYRFHPNLEYQQRVEPANLNPSQAAAYTSALSSKLAIIQGPPGTGKTFIGLKIMNTLLKCTSQQILVVCYTNHALDQFLEGILDLGHTSVIRVGSGSKRERLEKYNLHHHRELSIKNKSITDKSIYFHRNLRYWEIKDATEDCNTVQRIVCNFNGIYNFSHLDDVRNFDRFNRFFVRFLRAPRQTQIYWLLEEVIITMEPFENCMHNVLNQFGNIELEDDLNHFGNIKLENDDEFRELSSSYELISLDKIVTEMERFNNDMADLNRNSEEFVHLSAMRDRLKKYYKYLQRRLHETRVLIDKGDIFRDIFVTQDFDINYDDRWKLYASWLSDCNDDLSGDLRRLVGEYHILQANFRRSENEENSKLLRKFRVIGMTTTGAAKMQGTLQLLQCPIVIVEEAAEVLESHIITTLTRECKQLILIGDHKQLRPSTSDYNMEKHYNLSISLFERMINNGMPCSTLEVQHRMSPEICSLVAPTIYPTLQNHESVLQYPKIAGVDKNVFFITHKHHETQAGDSSKENAHEAHFLVRLARHLVLNGLEPNKITILAAYVAQQYLMLAEQKKFDTIKDVLITAVDNYQGEENNVILLSLVRNNEEGKIGFLALENRICVALSRAKHGLYIMGNMEQLCAAKNTIWPKIRDVLNEANSLGDAIPLRCTNNSHIIMVKTIKDFDKIPNTGVCNIICNFNLHCGHPCEYPCHAELHENMKCNKPCERIVCEYHNYKCTLKCYKKCSGCMEPKQISLDCGHTFYIPCSVQSDVICPEKLDEKLPCGHGFIACNPNHAMAPCSHPCDARIEPCKHICKRSCHIFEDADHETYQCTEMCNCNNTNCKSMIQHKCDKLCYEECPPCNMVVEKKRTDCGHIVEIPCHLNVDEIDTECTIEVEKIIDECGHKVICKCSDVATHDMCNTNCNKTLQCGHPCPMKCIENCRLAKCEIMVDSTTIGLCGHPLQAPCHQKKIAIAITKKPLKTCIAKCDFTLVCGHPCTGSCGECAQGRMHTVCVEKCQRKLVCGHQCLAPCAEPCQPCQDVCTYECTHRKCKKVCSVSCAKCSEACIRKCEHQQCTALCWQACTVGPCNEPCPKMLHCGHACVGLCGDICPPYCRVCNKEVFAEIGFEDTEDAKFVYLKNCKHIIEREKMDEYVEETMNFNKITAIYCQRCHTQVLANTRYSDYIKRAILDVQTVRKQYFQEIGRSKDDIQHIALTFIKYIAMYRMEAINKIKDNLNICLSKHNCYSKAAFKMRLHIIMHLWEIKNKVFTIEARDYILYLIDLMQNQNMISISKQELMDYNLELTRVERLHDIYNLNILKKHTICSNLNILNKRKLLEPHQFKRFSEQINMEVIEQLRALTDSSYEEEHLHLHLHFPTFSQEDWIKCTNGHVCNVNEKICTSCN